MKRKRQQPKNRRLGQYHPRNVIGEARRTAIPEFVVDHIDVGDHVDFCPDCRAAAERKKRAAR